MGEASRFFAFILHPKLNLRPVGARQMQQTGLFSSHFLQHCVRKGIVDVEVVVSLEVGLEIMRGIWLCRTAASSPSLLTLKWYTCEQGKVHSFSPPLKSFMQIVQLVASVASALSWSVSAIARLRLRGTVDVGRLAICASVAPRTTGGADDEDGQQSDNHLPYPVGSHSSHVESVRAPLGQVNQSGRRRTSGIAYCGGQCGHARKGHDEPKA